MLTTLLKHTAGLSLLLLFGLTACTDGLDPLPVEPALEDELPAPNYTAASSCYTVKFNVLLVPTPIPDTFEGTVSGDLEGTVTYALDAGSPFTGVTNTSGGTASWSITGGILPGLAAFETSMENRNIIKLSPDFQIDNQGSHRALEGVEKANLTYKGGVDLSTITVDHNYNGVICL